MHKLQKRTLASLGIEPTTSPESNHHCDTIAPPDSPEAMIKHLGVVTGRKVYMEIIAATDLGKVM